MRVRLIRDRLVQELAQSQISQNHWAMKLGLSRGHLSEILNGKHPFLSPRTRDKLLQGLGLPFDELFEVIDGDAWTHQSGADFQAAIHDRYVIDRELGQGGMGTVYLARDVKLGRLVAIKVISPEAVSGIGVKQFLREIRFTTQLEHPNILSVLDADEAAGYPFYVMPYVRGGSLRDLIRGMGTLPLDKAIPIVRDVAVALAAAHRQRIVHCDVKPANILLAEEHAYLADFGISRTVHLEALSWGKREGIDSSAGSPAYVSPEQVAGDEVDGLADVYSLGCVFHEMLAGKTPFQGETTMEMVAQRFTTVVPNVRDIRPDVPIGVARLLERTMSLEKRHRPSADEFLADLNQSNLSTHPVTRVLAGVRNKLGFVTGKIFPATAKSKGGTMEQWFNDIRYAIRSLKKRPGFVAVAMLTLALGIGANTALFSLVNGIFFHDPPFVESSRLVEISRTSRGNDFSMVSQRDYDDVRQNSSEIFTGVTTYKQFVGKVGGGDGPEEVVYGEIVNANYFDLLGVPAILGRTFLPEEDATPETHPVVVLGHAFWRNRFGSDPAVIGTNIRLNARQYTIVGVIGPTFRGKAPGFSPSVWVPMSMEGHLFPSGPDSNNRGATARLQPGVSAGQAMTMLNNLADNIDAQEGRQERFYTFDATLLDDIIIHPGLDSAVRAISLLMTGLVGLVLVITCANLAGFLLARATDRRKEMALRLALGANRSAVIRQLLTESVLLALLGGALGILLAAYTVKILIGLVPVSTMPIDLDVGIDLRVLLFTLGVATLAGVLLGLVPALRSSNPNLAGTLRSDASSNAGTNRRFNLRHVLIAGQMALSLVLLVGAGLFLRSFQEALDVDVGFSQEPAAIVEMDLRGSGYASDEYGDINDRIFNTVTQIPEITAFTLTTRLPLDLWNSGRRFALPGDEFDIIQSAAVGSDFFELLGIPILRGRSFTDGDAEHTPPVAIVSEAAAQRFWGEQEAVGQVIRTQGSPTLDIRVVGVAANAKVRTLGESPRPYVYLSLAQYPSARVQVFARGNTRAEDLVGRIRSAVLAMDQGMFITEARTLEEHMDVILYLPRMAASLFSIFAVLALVLASIGLYGVVSFAVARRTREMGIRISLGAQAKDVRALVVRGGMVLVLVGGAFGILLAIGVGRLVEGFLLGVSGLDPLTMVVIPIVLAAVSFVAAYLPARRASRVSPVEALRAE